MNAVMVCLNQWAEFVSHNPYAMEMDHGNRNCYNCRSFRHLTRNCKNRSIEGRIWKNRRLEYRNNGERRMIKEKID